ncbi:MAG: hypothetical protein Q8Q01_04340 [archaeon]|nr:hypothetical protein [archaeon]
MKIAFDCDDVLAIFTGHLAREYNRRFGTRINWYEVVPSYDELMKVLGDNAEKNITQLYLDRDYILNMEPMDGAVNGMQSLVEMGVKPYVVTARVTCKYAYTVAWLQKNFGQELFTEKNVFYSGYREHHHSTKGEQCRSLGVDYLVDDHPDHNRDAVKNGIKPILYTQRWNIRLDAEKEGFIRVANWSGLLRFLKEKIEERK